MSDYATVYTHDALCYPNPALKNPALARCCKAWKRRFRAKYRRTESEIDASDKAAAAFCAALPPLDTPQDCRDYITCVSYGILIRAIPEKDGGKLLYAAQIALSSFRSEPNGASQNQSRRTPEPPASSRHDQQGVATMESTKTEHSNSGFAGKSPASSPKAPVISQKAPASSLVRPKNSSIRPGKSSKR
jgi:hypothetical protein